MATSSSSYQKAIDYLYHLDEFKIDLGLERITLLLHLLNNPQDSLKIIHVAGTNGKGSVVAMVESILMEAGYNVCSYISPHLLDIRERYRINKRPVNENRFIHHIFNIRHLIESHQEQYPDLKTITCFEFMTAVAFLIFQEMNPDFVILEVGLGGRLDATNVIKNPLLSIITSISLDHTNILGTTPEAIALEKAGIIKSQRPVLFNQSSVSSILMEQSKIKKANAFVTNPKFFIPIWKSPKKQVIQDNRTGKTYTLNLPGKHQAENLPLVLKAIEILKSLGIIISDVSVEEGLKNILWEGRMHYIQEHNLLLDGAHNPAAIKILKENIAEYFPQRQKIWIFGTLETKDYYIMLSDLFNSEDLVILTEPPWKAVKAQKLQDLLLRINPTIKTEIQNTVEQAVIKALESPLKNKLIIITGSLYIVGETLRYLKHETGRTQSSTPL